MELFSLVRDVRACLTDDLRKKEYRGSPNPVTGHCYVANEALLFLLKAGGVKGWGPMFVKHEGVPHWFLRHESGVVLDPTSDQFKKPVPYRKAVGKGFLTKNPSKRARTLIERYQKRWPPKKMTLRQLATACIKAIDPSYTIKWQRKNTKAMTSFTWDGTGVLRMSESDPLLAIHDVAHVMLATKRRRKLPEFGLGEDPSNNSDCVARQVVSDVEAQDEELQTCSLHWAMGAYLQGKKGADEISDYLSIKEPPSTREVVDMQQRHGGLPLDFSSVVLSVRRECTD